MTELLRMNEVSERTGVPLETLRYWRKQGRGPKAARIGRRVVYRAADVETWIDQQFAESA
ncbi:hypothetical protein ASE01_19940 [Nocardioides sp. Root190]|uniref:helix-turn-helix transcriptional regulator n=1 Tax=Nocardioides sp. Root190 TaxID=1736488 RepID=UPI0006F938C0|nr:helix-turn-helix domain-containing protein [Nocardioides sp. Root190]KRB73049.1 hypothetical protein ASE01_19940 [Nocardioides sp. Root190]